MNSFQIQFSDFSSKQCYANATWNQQTDYSTCSITPRLKSRSQFHQILLAISLAFGLPAVLVLWLYTGGVSRHHQLQKLQLIRNLLIALVLRATLTLLTQSLIVMDELSAVADTETTAMSANDWPCKVLAASERLATNAVFTCMLLEGIFLHQLLTNVFASRGDGVPRMTLYSILGGGKTTKTL